MFPIMRWQARSAKGRLHCTRPALEELETRDVPAAHASPVRLALGAIAPPAAVATQATTNGNVKGAAGEIPAFFNGQSVTINVKELSDTASASILAKNPSLKTIYVTNDLDEKQDFAPVINAVRLLMNQSHDNGCTNRMAFDDLRGFIRALEKNGESQPPVTSSSNGEGKD